jgi:hypothetical protein
MAMLTTQFIQRTYRQPYRPANLQEHITREAIPDQTEPNGDGYKDFIWALAEKFTNSAEEAEAAVEEMQTDIQRCAERGVLGGSSEDRLVARIAWRRLMKFLK